MSIRKDAHTFSWEIVLKIRCNFMKIASNFIFFLYLCNQNNNQFYDRATS